MKQLSQIINDSKLDRAQLAIDLFPSHKHPTAALDRILKGDGELTYSQIVRLAYIAGISPAELFDPAPFKAKVSGDLITLTSGDFRAELNTKSWSSTIFAKNKMVHEFILHAQAITLKEYIQYLNELILTIPNN